MKKEIEDLQLILNTQEINIKNNLFIKKVEEFNAEIKQFDYYINKNIEINQNIIINKIIKIASDISNSQNIDIVFDMITLWHVLEHLNEPKKIVNLIEEKLINKGYVVVEVPNFNSFQHLISKNNWIHLDCPRHVTHFTKEGLINFFGNKKFKIIKKDIYLKDI